MATKKKTVKTKAPAAPVAKGGAALARVYKVKKMFEKGVRAEFMRAIPKEGASLETIAKKAGVTVGKARNLAYWLTANGFMIRLEE